MEGIYSWIKNIAFYLILILAVQNIVPDNKYKKYIKVFSGMILILLIITPITNVFGYTDKIANLFEGKLFEQDLEDMKTNLSGMESSVYEATMSQYKEYIKQQVTALVEDEGLYLYDFSCEINDEGEEIEITGMTLVLSRTDKSASEVYVDKIRITTKEESGMADQVEDISVINIKKSITDFYNISDDNINISIR